MSISSIADAVGPRHTLEQLLRRAEAQGRVLDFWWRDDDAQAATPALDRLLGLARTLGVPLGLAVIPAGATEALPGRLAGESNVWVLQHGWSHQQHNRPGEKKTELGDDRPLPAILGELRRGFERLSTLFPERFIPVLVPPWNRIGDAARAARHDIGLAGLSAFGNDKTGDAHTVNTHLDILLWKPERRPLPTAECYQLLCREVEQRLAGSLEPIGILSHHLVHGDESWELLDDLLNILANHPAVRWPALPALFRL